MCGLPPRNEWTDDVLLLLLEKALDAPERATHGDDRVDTHATHDDDRVHVEDRVDVLYRSSDGSRALIRFAMPKGLSCCHVCLY